MRTKFDVRIRCWSKKIFVLEGLGEVRDAGEQVLGLLGPMADRGGGR